MNYPWRIYHLISEGLPYAKEELRVLLSSIRLAGKVMNQQINKAGLAEILGKDYVQGKSQAKLEVRLFKDCLIEN